MHAVKFAEKKLLLIEPDSPLLNYQIKDTAISLTCRCTDPEKSPELLSWAYSLVEENVKHFYESCNWGWKPKSKAAEINAKWARYLIANVDDSPIAFSMFRFDMENNYPVLYCYELEVVNKYQGLGLGTHMMKVLEYIATKQKMRKVMLTVFKENTEAYKLYLELGYKIDIMSPGDEENEPYYIMSKDIVRPIDKKEKMVKPKRKC